MSPSAESCRVVAAEAGPGAEKGVVSAVVATAAAVKGCWWRWRRRFDAVVDLDQSNRATYRAIALELGPKLLLYGHEAVLQPFDIIESRHRTLDEPEPYEMVACWRRRRRRQRWPWQRRRKVVVGVGVARFISSTGTHRRLCNSLGSCLSAIVDSIRCSASSACP